MTLLGDWDVSLSSRVQVYPSHPCGATPENASSVHTVYGGANWSAFDGRWLTNTEESVLWELNLLIRPSICCLLQITLHISQLSRMWRVSLFLQGTSGFFFVMRWLENSGCVTDLYFLISEFNVWNTNALVIFMDAIKKINSLVMTTDELFFLSASFFYKKI